jgi:maleate isomerase
VHPNNVICRVGLLVPSSNTIIERDARVLPQEVSAHVARMKITRDDDDQLAALIDLAPAAADLLADAAVEAIAFACTSGSLHGGPGYDDEIVRRIRAATGIPTTTTATAVVDALRAEGATRVALVSPYEGWLNELVTAFLEGHGISVGRVVGFGLPDPLDSAALAPERIAEAVRSVDSSDVGAVVVSCTAFQGLEAARLVAGELGKPVVTSNQATLWKLLDMTVGAAGRPSELLPR